jgi:tetratricopeptide (TPR) repeat protein
LERAAKLQSKNGGQPVLSVQIQLASIYLQRNNTAEAYGFYHQILEAHPDNLDAWRGLIGTMQLTHRDGEALQEIKLIPPSIRKQLEMDVQFLQSEGSLYANAGDTADAIEIFNQVQKHYATLHQEPPADVEIQQAYLLYNTFNDRALYPTLMTLGARQDLSNTQRETIQGLWANWSVRRAALAFDNGNSARAIDILDAAAQAFPDNLTVRKAVAGGYLRVGRAKESLQIFKQIDFQDASAGDFQGAIGAALTANDKGQAETWLRQALDRYPHDSAILALAARFEQARGDNGRAADYWRASLAAMPTVSPTDRLAHELNHPEAIKPNNRAATPNDLAHLLSPDADATAGSGKSGRPLPPLPAYGQDPYDPKAPILINPNPQPGTTPGSLPVYPVPTTTTAPLPAYETTPTPRPQPGPSSQLLPDLRLPPEPGSTKQPSRAQATASTASRPATAAARHKPPVSYEGRMNLPSSDQTVATTDSASPRAQPQPVYPQIVEQSYRQSGQSTPNSAQIPSGQYSSAPSQTPSSGLRLSSEPMNPVAARAQALLTDETDGQLTQGFAPGSIRYLPNSASAPQSDPLASPAPADRAALSAPTYRNTQYTPSAQDAAAGAYSAQKPAAQPVQQPEIPLTPQPATPPATPAPKLKTGHKKRKPQPAAQTVPTLVTAPAEPQGPPPQLPVTDATTQGTQSTGSTGLTDQELQERNLPPLKGPWQRLTHPAPTVLSPRDEAEMQLRTIEGGYSAWLGGTGTIAHRTGDLGYSALTSLDASFEASVPLGTTARLTFIGHPAFLDSGQANGTAVINLTTAGVTASVPEPIGTMTGATASTTPPSQQNAAGMGGEAQLTFGNFSIAGGYTPYGFLVSNWIGRVNWRPGKGPITFSFNRDSVKDTQLSYAGLRDPGSISSFNPGNIWGGVVANSGNLQYSRGDLTSGFYAGVGGQYLTGFHVQENRRYDGSMGAYWRVFTMPEYGQLNVGANFFAMHYTYNLQAFTYGQGGYFSPQSYFLANIPITWTGHYLTKWHYTVLGSFGIQAFSEDTEPLAPLDLGIETNTFNNATLAALTSVGPNYDVRGQAAYAISDHWFVGGFAGANNSRNYTNVNAGFSIRYLFRSQPSTVAGPTGLFQTDDAHALRPLTVP